MAVRARRSRANNELPSHIKLYKCTASVVRIFLPPHCKYSGTSPGHLSNEDTVCSANHIQLCPNLPLK